jgi:hypothetical protein
VLLNEGSLDIHRSRTGRCIYSLPVRAVGSGVEAGALLVNNDDDSRYRRGDERRDCELAAMLIGEARRSRSPPADAARKALRSARAGRFGRALTAPRDASAAGQTHGRRFIIRTLSGR